MLDSDNQNYKMTDFVFTAEAKKRIALINKYTKLGIPVLLVGETGTGKTLSAEKAFENDKINKFNFSAETTIDQLIGYPSIDSTTNDIIFQRGPYLDAYENGHSLILDEFNLAHEDVLQCIEASLDSKFITIDDPKTGIKQIKMHDEFKLVATQNEAEFDFSRKRNKLTTKLTSKFTVLKFEIFSEDELNEIAKHTKTQVEIDDETIDKIVEFHNEWKNSIKDKNFTIRNMKAVIQSISDNISVYQAILFNYGSSCNKEQLEELIKTMENLNINKDKKEFVYEFPEPKNFFRNPSIDDVFQKIMFFAEQDQPILLVGDDGCGKTQIAKWAANIISKNGSNMMVCTPETTIADLIGNYIPIPDQGIIGKLPVKWIDGPIVRSAAEGKCVILDQIECALPQYIERINPIFDSYSKKRYLGNKTTFIINEKPDQNEISINNEFKFIATACKNDLNKLSPALLNRFVIINIENQLNDINRDTFTEKFVSSISPNMSFNVKQYLFSHAKDQSISTLVKIIKGIEALKDYIPKQEDCYKILEELFINKKTPILDQKYINNILKDIGDTKEFHFKGVHELENIIALIDLLKKIGQHCILQSTTGFGKTSAAIMLAKALGTSSHKVSFNSETKISDLFSNLTIKKGNFNNADGQLFHAMKEGGFFVADEINLAETTVMESLTIALEQKGGETINLPNCEEPVKVSNDFFFIGCQNDTSMFGRKQLPRSIAKKVVTLEYPFPDNEIANIIGKIFDEPFDKILRFSVNHIANLVKKLRKDDEFSSRPWSLREVRRFMNRCLFFNNQSKIMTLENKQIPFHIHAAYMIYSTFSKPEDHINSIVEVIKDSFKLSDVDKENVRSTLNSPVIVEEKEETIVLKKGIVQQTLGKRGIKVSPKAKAYWETLFIINMIPPNEPLLLTGPSGYKTFMAKQLCEINEEKSMLSPRVVTLSRDSNTSSLIGSTALVDHSSFNTFIFDMLYSIAVSHTELTFDILNLKKTFRGTDKDIEKLNSIVSGISKKVPEYKSIIKNLYDNLKNNIKAQESQSVMKDYTTVFRPGLITSQILQGRTLILKNFSKPPVAVMERFNELFSINPELTLTEDYSNTIVPANEIKIVLPEKGFRIIATCGENETAHLSEAMLSRFNVVYVKPYDIDDQKAILGEYFPENTENDFIFRNLIAHIAKDVVENTQISKLIINQEKALDIAINLMNNKEKGATGEEPPFKFSGGVIKSKFNKIASTTSVTNFPETDLVFTPSVQVMADRIFAAFALNRPIIVSGPNGNGKSETVKYVASCLGIRETDIISIQISRSTTIESIYGKNGISEVNGKRSFDFIPTQLLRAVADSYDYNDGRIKLIIIEEINLASQSVLDALAPLFDNDPKSRILQPNGVDVGKKKFFIVGLASGNFKREDISSGPIIFQKDDYPIEEFELICNKIMKKSGIELPVSQFVKLKTKLMEKKMSEILSVRSCMHYNLLESIFRTSEKLTNYASKIIFNSLSDTKYANVDKLPVEIDMSGSSLCVSNLFVDVNASESNWVTNKSNVYSLSESEKQLFVLLAANAIKKETSFPLIVKGPTASGKTFTIQLFANIIGQKLTVLQMNSDSSISSIIGGYKPSDTVTKSKIEYIKEKIIACGELFNDIANDIQKNKIITTDILNGYVKTMQQRLTEETETETADLIREAISEIEDACSLFNRVKLSDSAFVDAMVNGNWILLDGIESAPSDIIERITTLLDCSPMLNIYEHGNDCVYSAHPSNTQKKIHDNFRIFITYNPDIPNKKTILTNTVLSRCIVFTMKPFDETVLSSSISAYYNLADLKFKGFKDKEHVALRIGKTHILRKNKEENAVDHKINGRTLIHICRALSRCKSPVEIEVFKDIVKENYISSITDESKDIKELEDDFRSRIDKNDYKELKKLTEKAIIDSSDLKRIIEAFKDVPRYSAMLDLIKKVDLADLFKIREVIDEEKTLILEAAKSQAQTQDQSEYLFRAVLFSKISSIIKDIEKHTPENLMHSSISSIDLEEYKGLFQSIFLIDRITEICANGDIEKCLPSYLLTKEKTENYNLIAAYVKVLALLKSDDEIITITEKSFPEIFGEIYESYLMCINNRNTKAVQELDSFYLKIMKIASKIGYDIKVSQLISNENILKTFSEMKLSECTKTIKDILLESKKIKKQSTQENSKSKAALTFTEQAKRIIQNKEKNYKKYEALLDIFEMAHFVLPDSCSQQVIEQLNSESSIKYDFTAHHTLESSESNENVQWFVELVNYNHIIQSIKQLSNKDTCFKALINIPEDIPVNEILKTFKKNAFKVDQNRSKYMTQIKQKYFSYLLNNQEIMNLIIPENMKNKLQSFYTKESCTISSSWIDAIKNLNDKVDIDFVIEIPTITDDDFIFIARKLLQDPKIHAKSEVNKIISREKAKGPNKTITFLMEIRDSIGQQAANNHEKNQQDMINYEDNIETYFNNNPSEAIFLSMNPAAAKALSSIYNSNNENKLTYGVFLLRLYSPLSLITFYTNNQVFPEDLKKKISDVIIKLYKQKKFESFALVASLLLDPAPVILQNEFLGSLFHDSIIQIVSFSTDNKYKKIIDEYLPLFIESYLVGNSTFNIYKWDENISSNDESSNFLLNPIKVFADYVNKKISEKHKELNEERMRIDKAINESQTIIKGFVDQFIKSRSEDKNDFMRKTSSYQGQQEFMSDFEAFSSSFLSFFNRLPEAFNEEIKMIAVPQARDVFNEIKKEGIIKIQDSRKLAFAIFPLKDTDSEYDVENMDGDKVTLSVAKNQNIAFRIPDDMELKNAENSNIQILYVYVSKVAQPSQNYGKVNDIVSKLRKAKISFAKMPKEQQEKMRKDDSKEGPSDIIFGDFDQSDLKEFIIEVPRNTIEEELNEYSNIRFRGTNEFKPENTINTFRKLIQEAKKYDGLINSSKENDERIRSFAVKLDTSLFMDKFTIKPDSLNTYNSNDIRLDTIKDSKPLNIPAITITNDSFSTNFKSFDVSVENVVLGVQTTPIKVNIFCFGDQNLITFKVLPEDPTLPDIFIENGEDSVILNIPIDQLKEETKFSGEIKIRSMVGKHYKKSFGYSVKVTFRNPVIFLESPGNEFVYSDLLEKYIIRNKCYDREITKLLTKAVGIENLNQEVTFENYESASRMKNPPIVVSNKPGENRFKYQNDKFGRALVKCTFSPSSVIQFSSHTERIKENPIKVLAYSYTLKQFTELKETRFSVGNINTKHYIYLGMILPYPDIPKFSIKSDSDDIVVAFDDDFSIEEAETSYFRMFSFNARANRSSGQNEKCNIIFSIETESLGKIEFPIAVDNQYPTRGRDKRKNRLYYCANSNSWSKERSRDSRFYVTENSVFSLRGGYYIKYNENTGFAEYNQNVYNIFIKKNDNGKYSIFSDKCLTRDDQSNALISYFARQGEFWWPARDPSKMSDMFSKISELPEKDLCELVNIYSKRTCQDNIKRTHKADKNIVDTIKENIQKRFEQLKNQWFITKIPCNVTEIKAKQSEMAKKLIPPSDEFIKRALKETGEYTSRIKDTRNKDNDKKEGEKAKPIIVLEDNKMRLVSKQEKENIIEHGAKIKLSFDFETVKEDKKEFAEIKELTKTIRSPKQILDVFTKIDDASKQFSNALASYFDDGKIKNLPGNATKQLLQFASFYEWSKKESTLKCTSFISVVNDINQNYRANVKRLIDSGVELPEKIRISAGNVQNNIDLPTQGKIIVDFKPWMVNNSTPLSLNFDFNTTKPNDEKEKDTDNKDSPTNKQEPETKANTGSELVPGRSDVQGEEGDQNGETTNLDDISDLAKDLLKRINDDIEINLSVEEIQLPNFKDTPSGKLTVESFIKASRSLSNDLIKRLRERGMENYTGTEVFLMLDIGFTISERQKAALFISYCAFAIALSVLRIPTSLCIFSDTNIQIEIKSSDEELTEVYLQKVLDTLSLKRKVSDLITATEFVKNKFSHGVESHSLFVFTDGLLVNTNAKKWSNRIPENALLTTLILPQNDKESIPIIRNAFAQMNKVEGFKYLVLRSEKDIYETNEKVIESFVSGMKQGKAKEDVKEKIEVIIPKEEIEIKKKFIQEKSDYKNDLELFFTSKKDSYSSDTVKLPSISLDNKYDEFVVKCHNAEFDLQHFDDILKDCASIRPLFAPNKPTQATSSEKGYGISLIGLIRCSITNGQDKRIFLEKNSGYISSYSIFVVVDCTPSICSLTTLGRSIDTIVSLLVALKKTDGASLTLIAATGKGPVVLCMNTSLENVVGYEHSVIVSLIQCMMQPSIHSSVADALNAVYAIRSKQQELGSVCFVFTEGELYGNERLQTMSIITAMEVLRTSVIGVGIGVCPSSIETIFKSSIWARKPTSIPTALHYLIKNEKCDGPISYLNTMKPTSKAFEECIKLIKSTEFAQQLMKTRATFMSTFMKFNVIDPEIAEAKDHGVESDGNSRIANAKDDPNIDLGMGKEWNIRILICQFWDYSLSGGRENPNITYRVLVGIDGVVEALKFLGATVDIVQNYREAISCLTSGKYNQAWVICGRGNIEKPETRPPKDKPEEANKEVYKGVEDYKLAIAFVDTIELFRIKGGGISFFAEKGFTYELNYYLSRVELYNCKCLDDVENPKKVSVNIRFDKEDDSINSYLKAGPIFVDDSFHCINKTFDKRDRYYFSYIGRRLFGYNVMNLYEGDSIACADPDSKIEPFNVFSYSTKGLISNAYYMAPVDSDEGDIIIDGAISRLFIDITKEGIRRLVRNMAVWLTSYERYMFRSNVDMEDAIKIKPGEFEPIKLPKDEVKTYEKPIDKGLDIAFVFDATQSTEKIKTVLESIIECLVKFIDDKFPGKAVRTAEVSFRDYALAVHKKQNKKTNKGEKLKFLSINEEKETIIEFVKSSKPQGGCNDGPEDWVYAFNEANSLKWNPNAKKIVVLITDTGGHGTGFHDGFNPKHYTAEEVEAFDEVQTPKLLNSLGKLAKRDVNLLLIGTSENTRKGFDKLIETYESKSGNGKAQKIIVDCMELADNSKEFIKIKDAINNCVSKLVAETFMATNHSSNIVWNPVKNEESKTPNFDAIFGPNKRNPFEQEKGKRMPQERDDDSKSASSLSKDDEMDDDDIFYSKFSNNWKENKKPK